MGLTYQSIRGGEKEVTAFIAILQGLAEDGGLSMPSGIPELDVPLEELASMTYQETAYEVMKLFLTDYTEAEPKDRTTGAYDSKSDIEEMAPLARADGAYYLELYHGSIVASKDMALSILPHPMTMAARKNHVDREIVILTVTSGDMGKAVMVGSADAPGTRITAFHPKDGVNKVQELQMHTQKGDNASVVAIHGNFDDTQISVKKVLGGKDLEAEPAGKGFRFSLANSINTGRLAPQTVYYVYVYTKLSEAGEIDKGEKTNVVVPTGNFGNILAAYSAKRMGLSAKTLVCASNDNRVLYDFFTTGTYDRRREFIFTNSPSTDIFVSNNLERLIYLSTGCDAWANAALMQRLSEEGRYEVTPGMRAFMSDLAGDFATQGQGAATIRRLFGDTGYLIDTHIGVAATAYANYRRESEDGTKTVMASTTSPYKSSHSVMEAIAGREGLESKDELEIVDALSTLFGVAVPQAVEEIRHTTVRHNRECGVDDMKNEVKDILGISRFNEKHLPLYSRM